MIDAKTTDFAKQLISKTADEQIGIFDNQRVFLENKTGAKLLMLRRAVEVASLPEDAEPDGFGFQNTKNALVEQMGRRLTLIGDVIEEKVMGRTIPDYKGNEVLTLADKEFLGKRLEDESLVGSQLGIIEVAMYKGADQTQLNVLLNDNGAEFDKGQCKATINLLQTCYTDDEIRRMSSAFFLWHKFDNRP